MRNTGFAVASVVLAITTLIGAFFILPKLLAQNTSTTLFSMLASLELPPLRRSTNYVVAWSPEGQTLAVAGDTNVWLYSTDNLEEIGQLQGHTDTISHLAWNPEGNLLASGGWDDTVRIWDVVEREILTVFSEHDGLITSLAWKPGDNLIASSSWDGTVQVWNPESGQSQQVLQVMADNHRGTAINSMSWNPDGALLATASFLTAHVQVWNVTTGIPLFKIEPDQESWIVAWSSDGAFIATNPGPQIWNADNGEFVIALEGHEGFIAALKWSPDGRKLASNSLDGTIHIWDVETWQMGILDGHLGMRDPYSLTDYADTIAWSPDGAQLVSIGEDDVLRIWDTSTAHQDAQQLTPQ